MQKPFKRQGSYGEVTFDVAVYGVPKGIGAHSHEIDEIIDDAIERLHIDLGSLVQQDDCLCRKPSFAATSGSEEGSMVIEVRSEITFNRHVERFIARSTLNQFCRTFVDSLIDYIDQCKARAEQPITTELQQVLTSESIPV